MIEPGLGSRMQGAAIAALVLVLDQVSKTWILESVMNPPRVIEITPFFNIVLAWNRGVSFGMFNTESDHGPLILTALAVVIVIALSVWLWRAQSMFSVVALGLVIGGAVGEGTAESSVFLLQQPEAVLGAAERRGG